MVFCQSSWTRRRKLPEWVSTQETRGLETRRKSMAVHNYNESRNRSPLSFVKVPLSLEAGENTYALKADGDCLSPFYCPGDILVCDPDQAPAPGDFVAVWWRGGVRLPSAKRLVRALPPRDLWKLNGELQAMLICEQLNPPKRLSAPMTQIQAVHKILGKALEE